MDPFIYSKAWIATHVGYFLHSPSSYAISTESVEYLYSAITVPGGDWSAVESGSDLAWNISLHLGKNSLTGNWVDPAEYDGPSAYQRIFAECGSSVRGLGPRSTIDWLIDCVGSANRRLLRPRNAIKVFGALGRSFRGDFFELAVPPGLTTWVPGSVQFRKISNLLAAQRAEVFLGWLIVVMGMIETSGGLLGSRDRKVLKTGRRTDLMRADMADVFSEYVGRRLPGTEYIEDWIEGEVSFWALDDMGVS